MQITQVKIFPVNEDKLKAFVSIVFDHCFMVNDIKVIQGKDGLFLSMPSRRKKSGEFKDVAHPLNNETRRLLEEQVLNEYRQVVPDVTPRRPDRDVDYDASGTTTTTACRRQPRPDARHARRRTFRRSRRSRLRCRSSRSARRPSKKWRRCTCAIRSGRFLDDGVLTSGARTIEDRPA
ncbi:MAG: septation regulator SpoVG [Thermoanaerobaculia bacterium]|nr:septation regulator SpoVG [Thermoanaerobaculia bacterium]